MGSPRWRAGRRTFAAVHAFRVELPGAVPFGLPLPDHVGPITYVSFNARGLDADELITGGLPFFSPSNTPWRVGMVLDDCTDWERTRPLLAESSRFEAPEHLAVQVEI